MRALDLFAGTGWGVACQRLGVLESGVDNAPAVLATREANGMHTAFTDVWAGLDGREVVPEHDVLIASPPCQTFSMAGGGAGRKALDQVLALIADGAYLDPAELRAFGEEHDDRTALVLAPLTYALRYRPKLVVLEQVPPVLPVWEAIGRVLGMNGYQVATGVLNAEQYGVPQTRKRAILIARRGALASMPTPTHSRFYSHAPARLDPGVLPWVSMAEALGWGAPEPDLVGFPRRADTPSNTAGADVVHLNGTDYRARDLRPAGHPSQAVTGKARSWSRFLGAGASELAGGGRQQAREEGEPAHTITGAGSAAWVHERPATTIVGSFDPHMVRGPGHTATKAEAGPGVHSQNKPNSVRVTVEEAAALQSYPDGFQWVGSKTATFQQIGNAVPPLLAEAILRHALNGLP